MKTVLRPHLLIPLLAAMLLVYAVLWRQQIAASGSLDRYAARTDFYPTLVAAAIINIGEGYSIYDLDQQWRSQAAMLPPGLTQLEVLPFIQGPLLATLFAPIYPMLGLGGSFIVLLLLNLFLLAASLWLLHQSLPSLHNASPTAKGLTLLAAVSYYPLFTTLLLGQVSILLLFSLSLSFYCLRRRQNWEAGAALAILLLKPQLLALLLLLLLLGRCWRVLGGLIVAGLGSYLLCAISLGFGWPVSYVEVLLRISTSPNLTIISPYAMQSWRGLTANLFGESGLGLAFLTLLALATLALLLLIWRSMGWQPTTEHWPLAYAATVIAVVLTSYHLLPHDLTLLLLPGLVLADYVFSMKVTNRDWWLAVLLLGWLLPLARLVGYDTLPLSLLPMVGALLLIADEVRQVGTQVVELRREAT